MFKYVFVCITALLSTSFALAETCTGNCKVKFDFDVSTGCILGREDACFTNNGLTVGDKSNAVDFYIQQGNAAAGSGMFEGRGRRYSNGPGYLNGTIPGGGYLACAMRYYVKTDPTYFNYSGGPHGPGLTVSGTGAGGCGMGGTTEQQQDNYYLYRAAQGTKCCSNAGVPGGDECDITGPDTPTVIYNSRYYMVEERYMVDNTCSGTPSYNNCNGIYQQLYDDVPVFNRANINHGGTQYSALITGYNGPRVYMHTGWPFLEPKIYYDNYRVDCTNSITGATVNGAQTGVTVITVNSGHSLAANDWVRVLNRASSTWLLRQVTGTTSTSITLAGTAINVNNADTLDKLPRIGAASDANTPGTASAKIYYQNSYSEFEWSGGNQKNDCLGGFRLGTTKYNDWWRDGSTKATLSTLFGKNVDNVFDAVCTNSPNNYAPGSMLISTVGADDGAGISYYQAETHYTSTHNINMTWARIRSGQDYGTKTALNGFTAYKCANSSYSKCGGTKANCDEAQWGRFIAIGLIKDTGVYKWGVIERDVVGASTDSVISYISSSVVSLDSWDKVELSVNRTNNTYTLYINDALSVQNRPFQLATTAGAGNYNSNNLLQPVYGIIDRCGSVGGNQLNLDSGAITTASTSTCEGWAAGECPFSGPIVTPDNFCPANNNKKGGPSWR